MSEAEDDANDNGLPLGNPTEDSETLPHRTGPNSRESSTHFDWYQGGHYLSYPHGGVVHVPPPATLDVNGIGIGTPARYTGTPHLPGTPQSTPTPHLAYPQPHYPVVLESPTPVSRPHSEIGYTRQQFTYVSNDSIRGPIIIWGVMTAKRTSSPEASSRNRSRRGISDSALRTESSLMAKVRSPYLTALFACEHVNQTLR
ncbi:hypothetical protein VNI00_011580 [Paramarasmius palmivorus]|uniref:Uncharacterized protein n=1 Tax=Paramarasmius palmivorus TaxID=297713 RepID=A0AAW0CCE9_9AGAR